MSRIVPEALTLAIPTAKLERFEIMDVLRGFALFGVLIANLAELGGADILATSTQLEALSSAPTDRVVTWLLDLFVFDKANTLFAVLFGMGFWIQMERLSARGIAFGSLYLRRISLLLGLGLLHLFGWFAWDILHLYGAAAFILYFSRNLSDRTLFWVGMALLLFGRPLVTWLGAATGVSTPALDIAFSEDAILARQAAAVAGDAFAWVSAMNHQVWFDWVLGGTLLAWFPYVIGRFYIGAWLARQGWIQSSERHLSTVKSLLLLPLISGLALQIISQILGGAPEAALGGAAPLIATLLQAAATPLIAAGYVCGLILLVNSEATRWLVRSFAPVGQMALTNYLIQSPIIILILTGIGPGFALAGHAGSTTYTLLSVIVFAAQMVFSAIWMSVFAYGPAEWVWRTLTYGSRPKLRRAA